MNGKQGRPKLFRVNRIQLGLDKATNDDLLTLMQALGQSPTGAARYAIRQMAKAFQISEATLQGVPQALAQVENGQPR